MSFFSRFNPAFGIVVKWQCFPRQLYDSTRLFAERRASHYRTK